LVCCREDTARSTTFASEVNDRPAIFQTESILKSFGLFIPMEEPQLWEDAQTLYVLYFPFEE